MGDPVRYELLGPLRAWRGDEEIPLGGAKQRTVLATLLLDLNRSVSAEKIIDTAWGDQPPASAQNLVQTYVSRLRRALEPGKAPRGPHHTLLSIEAGYQLRGEPAQLDSLVFARRLAAATEHHRRGDLALAEREVGAALELWRGRPLGGLGGSLIEAARERLTDSHVAALELRATVDLDHGRHADAVAALSRLVAEFPLRERLWSLLLLALYRGGRQADALAHYELVRTRLAEELGVDPSPQLRDLHQRILTADPALAGPRPALPAAATAGPAAGPVTDPAGPVRGLVRGLVNGRGTVLVPRQLPAPPRPFTGRTRELAVLTAALDTAERTGTVVISAVGGVGGIGKTWLALHWAHQHADRFPDGQLYVNLRGFDPTGTPTPPAAALRGFLDALGVEPDRIPVGTDAQAALYRSLVAGRRMLVVLDNARDAEQVRPLLPGTAASAVLVTSRNRMAGLVTAHGAYPLALDVLSEPDARDLLAHRLGWARLAAEPGAVADLVACCAGLPLALAIVAARAATHPDLPLATWAGELRDVATRLGTLDGADPAASLPAVLSWSYDALDAEHAGVFGLLGLAPGPDIGVPAAAGLTGLPTARTAAVLAALEQASLLQQHRPRRYRMHDLIRLHASEHARRDQPEQGRQAALRRLVGHYAHTAFAGDRVLFAHRPPIDRDPPPPGCRPHPLCDQDAALAWFDAERPCLLGALELAGAMGWHGLAWLLAWSLNTFHWRRGHLADNLVSWGHGLRAAAHLDDPAARTLAHRRLGHVSAGLGRHAQALEQLHEALALAERGGDRSSQAHIHQSLARAWDQRGDDVRALEHARHSLRLCREVGNRAWEADALNHVGWFAARLGHHDQARIHCEAALVLQRRHGNRVGEAATLDSLGYLAHLTGDHEQALAHYQDALALHRDLGNTYLEAETLEHLGHAHAGLGRRGRARDAWRQARRLYRAQNRGAAADRLRRELAVLDGHGDGTAR